MSDDDDDEMDDMFKNMEIIEEDDENSDKDEFISPPQSEPHTTSNGDIEKLDEILSSDDISRIVRKDLPSTSTSGDEMETVNQTDPPKPNKSAPVKSSTKQNDLFDETNLESDGDSERISESDQLTDSDLSSNLSSPSKTTSQFGSMASMTDSVEVVVKSDSESGNGQALDEKVKENVLHHPISSDFAVWKEEDESISDIMGIPKQQKKKKKASVQSEEGMFQNRIDETVRRVSLNRISKRVSNANSTVTQEYDVRRKVNDFYINLNLSVNDGGGGVKKMVYLVDVNRVVMITGYKDVKEFIGSIKLKLGKILDDEVGVCPLEYYDNKFDVWVILDPITELEVLSNHIKIRINKVNTGKEKVL